MIRRALMLGALYLALFFALERLLFATILVVNTTESVPIGVYVKVWWKPRVGDIVYGCLPDAIARQGRAFNYLDAGDCAGGVAAVFKRVEALPGTRVVVTRGGVQIDGRVLGHSQRVADTAANANAIPLGVYTVGPSRFWLGSTSPLGWDSRYYGDVRLSRATVVVRL